MASPMSGGWYSSTCSFPVSWGCNKTEATSLWWTPGFFWLQWFQASESRRNPVHLCSVSTTLHRAGKSAGSPNTTHRACTSFLLWIPWISSVCTPSGNMRSRAVLQIPQLQVCSIPVASEKHCLYLCYPLGSQQNPRLQVTSPWPPWRSLSWYLSPER